MQYYDKGCVTSGSHFTYQGVEYGKYTIILFKEEFYKRVGEWFAPMKAQSWTLKLGYKYPYFRTFSHATVENGKTVWHFSSGSTQLVTHHFVDVDPERDIEKIITPVYYYTPKELVKKRLNNGTWILYVWKQTLIYLLCLLISPIFQEWYIIWTTGLYLYLRLCYIELSKGELHYIF